MSIASEKVDLYLSEQGKSYDQQLLDMDVTRIKNMLPGQSLIRLGDGELDVLLGNNDKEKIWARKRPFLPWLTDKMVDAIIRADIVGIPRAEMIISVGSEGIGSYSRQTKADIWSTRLDEIIRGFTSKSKYICSNIFIYDLNLIPDLIKDKKVLIVHCRGRRIADKFQNGTKFKEFFNIYPGKAIGVDITSGSTLPESVRLKQIAPEVIFSEWVQSISHLGQDTLESIDYILIGAGALGKPLALHLKNIAPSSIAIDVGCILSLYSKLKDRGILYPHGLLGKLFRYF